jgi:hypothetical protein
MLLILSQITSCLTKGSSQRAVAVVYELGRIDIATSMILRRLIWQCADDKHVMVYFIGTVYCVCPLCVLY